MSDLDFKISVEWEDPGAARGAELRATWCRLFIQVGKTPVTRVLDARAQTVRDAVYCSAYPLAEWLAFNWWSLLNEPDRQSPADERHNFRFAREGFALPDLELYSEDSLVRAIWKPYAPVSSPVKFIEEGFALLPSKTVAAELGAFVDKVVARLGSNDAPQTTLAREWEAIRGAASDEQKFCEASGSLGLDPYNLEDREAHEILEVEKRLPAEIRREFFLAADAADLGQQVRWVSKCLRQLDDFKIKTALAGKKGLYHKELSASTPWQCGYDLAKKFRKDFGLGKSDRPLSLEKVCQLKQGILPVFRVSEEQHLDAVAMLTSDLGPQVATSKDRDTSKHYQLARAVGEYLCSGNEESALLTRISSDKQKRNRAFAAELLAPADGIRKLLSGSQVSHDEIAEIAAHLRVSEWLVKHQVQNHRIAVIEEAKPLMAED